MAFNFGQWLARLFSGAPAPAPATPSEPAIYLFAFTVQDVSGRPLAGVVAAFRLDDGSPTIIATSDGAGLVELRTTWRGVGITVYLSKAGYQPTSERRLLPLLSTSGPAEEWPAVTVLSEAIVLPPTPAPIAIAPVVPVPSVTPSLDAIVLADAVIAAADCPDVRRWPVFTTLRSLTLADNERAFERGDTMPDFEGRDTLPPAMGSQGAISYTLWLGCWLQNAWHILPIVECIRGYVPTGQLLLPGHVGPDLLYYADAPLTRYQPHPGEDVIFFVTTGDTRRQNVQALGVTPARTTVLKVKWQVGVTAAAA